MSRDPLPPKQEIDQVLQTIYSDLYRDNPYLFVQWAFPWGIKGGPLENQTGPRAWQKRELLNIAEHIKENKRLIAEGKTPKVYKLAVASGRGIGKSALVSWITLWMLACHFSSTTLISANTDSQISDVTFGEVGKWLAMSHVSFLFTQTQKSIDPAPWYSVLLKKELKRDTTYYYAKGRLWDADNPSAFAGPHSAVGMCLIFDEASGVPATIWTTAQGYFTDINPYRFWFAFSNPRTGTGAFHDCFHTEGSDWNLRNISSLDVEGIDTSQLEQIIKKNGSDSDEARVEVFGLFPKSGDRQFISRQVVEEAARRELVNYRAKEEALIMGVDVARFGDDKSVIAFRAGRDARSIPAQIYSGLDNMALVAKIEQAVHVFNPDHICIDAGAGAGVIDRLRQLGYKITEVHFGSSPSEPHFFDLRTELYARIRDWLPGGAIEDIQDLKSGLSNPEKELVGKESKEKLESKEKMKKRGIKSPDHADALALTFAVKGAKKAHHTSRKNAPKKYRERASIFD